MSIYWSREVSNLLLGNHLQGKVTDAQLWGETLSLEEMIGITSCSSFPEGNLLAWNSQNWMLNSSRATAVEDDLDLQDEVCPSSSSLSVTHCTTWWSCLITTTIMFCLCKKEARCAGSRISPSCLCSSVEQLRPSRFAGRNPFSQLLGHVHMVVHAFSSSAPGGSLPRLHLTPTAINLTRFTAFSRGGNNITWNDFFLIIAFSSQGEPWSGQWVFCIWTSDSHFFIFFFILNLKIFFCLGCRDLACSNRQWTRGGGFAQTQIYPIMIVQKYLI